MTDTTLDALTAVLEDPENAPDDWVEIGGAAVEVVRDVARDAIEEQG